jgi:glutathione S-transferase
VTRFLIYDVGLDQACAAHCERIVALPEMVEWCTAALRECEELDMEF